MASGQAYPNPLAVTPAATKLTIWMSADDGSRCPLGFELELLLVPRRQGGTYVLAAVGFRPGRST